MRDIQRAFHHVRSVLRDVGSRLRPGAAELDLLSVRALIGYALMQLFRRDLAPLAGHTINPAFEACRAAERALRRIESLSPDVPGHPQVMFIARVTVALARNSLGDTLTARELLQQARAFDPHRADSHPVFIYASALVAPDKRTRLGLFRRAVELSPRFEVAQFQLAMEMEELWRSRDVLEKSVAALVLQEYYKLLQINPGNLAGWANSGYISWLLESDDCLSQARTYFEQGLRFKRIKREIFASELDYGLARIYAERGEIVKAYEHYISSITALFSRESDLTDFRSYFFNSITPAIQERVERYCGRVVAQLRAQQRHECAARGGSVPKSRIRNSVHAFVLNDLGEAYLYGNHLDKAVKVFRRAIRRNPDYALPYHNLGQLGDGWSDQPQVEYLKRVRELQPRWPTGQLMLARYYASKAPDALSEAAQAVTVGSRIEKIKSELGSLDEASRRQYDQETQAAISLGASVPQGIVPSFSSEQREDLEEELEKLEKQLAEHQRNTAEKTKDAKTYREDAHKLAGSLLPHQWLWDTGELGPHRLADPILKSELKWEREFNDLHVQALYAWTLRFVYDPQETSCALQFLDHIREHYWPADPELLSQWLRLKLEGGDLDCVKKKEYASNVLSVNPAVVTKLPRLGELGFDDNDQIILLKRAIEFGPENTDVSVLRERLANVYQNVASAQNDPYEAAGWYRKAAEIDPTNARGQSALATKLEEAAGGQELATLEEALAAAVKAAEIAPRSTNYAEQVERLRRKRASLQRHEQICQEIEDRFGADAKNLGVVERPMLVEYSDDLADLFKPKAATDEENTRNEALKMLSDGLFYELGVRFPSPDFRRLWDSTEKNRYQIRLWGIPIAAGELRTDRWLFNAPPSTLKNHGVAAENAINPANGILCSWVGLADLEKAQRYADQQHIYYWKPFEYVVLHLAGVFRNNALDFLRVDDVVRLLSYWGLEEEGVQLQRDGLLLELTNALRALVADQFRILYPEATIRAFREAYAPGKSLTEVVERMRGHPEIRKQSSYFRSDQKWPLFRVGPNFEAVIENGLRIGKGMVLALEPEMTQDLLKTVRQFVSGLVPNCINERI
jgi:tetratricopeptide (TPR) repeat protein